MAGKGALERIGSKIRGLLEGVVALWVVGLMSAVALVIWSWLDGLPGSMRALAGLAAASLSMAVVLHVREYWPRRLPTVAEKRDRAEQKCQSFCARLDQFANRDFMGLTRQAAPKKEAFLAVHGVVGEYMASAIKEGHLEHEQRHIRAQAKDAPDDAVKLKRRCEKSAEYTRTLRDSAHWGDICEEWDGR